MALDFQTLTDRSVQCTRVIAELKSSTWGFIGVSGAGKAIEGHERYKIGDREHKAAEHDVETTRIAKRPYVLTLIAHWVCCKEVGTGVFSEDRQKRQKTQLTRTRQETCGLPATINRERNPPKSHSIDRVFPGY